MRKIVRNWLIGVSVLVLLGLFLFFGVFQQSVLSGGLSLSQVVPKGVVSNVSFGEYNFVVYNVLNHITSDASGHRLSSECVASLDVFRGGVLVNRSTAFHQVNFYYTLSSGFPFSFLFLDSYTMSSSTCVSVDNSLRFGAGQFVSADIVDISSFHDGLLFSLLVHNNNSFPVDVVNSYNVRLGSGFFSGVSRSASINGSVSAGGSESFSVFVPLSNYSGLVSLDLSIDGFVSPQYFTGWLTNSCVLRGGAKRSGDYYDVVSSCVSIPLGSGLGSFNFSVSPDREFVFVVVNNTVLVPVENRVVDVVFVNNTVNQTVVEYRYVNVPVETVDTVVQERTDWTMVVIISVIAVFVIVFLFIILRKKKGRRK